MKKFLILFSILFIVYCVTVLNTNPLKQEVMQLLKGEISTTVTEGKVINLYNKRDDIDLLAPNKEIEAQARLTRLFVLHDFLDGYMWVNYTYEIKGKNGDRIMGAWNIPARWKIHRENGKWEIVDIKEAP